MLGDGRMSGEETSGGPLLFLGCMAFGPIRERSQHLAAELSRHAETLYVEPHRSWLRAAIAGGGLPRAEPPASPVEGLEILTPRPALPFSGYLPGVNRLNYARTARLIRRRLEGRGHPGPRAIVASFPKQVDLLRFFPGCPVCYDVMDDYPLFFDAWQGAVIARLHERLLRHADVVVVTSEALAERCRGAARRIVRVANGVSPAFHEACGRADADRSVLALPAPRFGYVGTIQRWIDFEILRHIARAFPDGTVIVVGPVECAPPDLPDNVRFLGERPHDAIPPILRAFDAGLVPFKRSRLTDAVNPLKVYEYLSAGLPVLSSDFAGIHEFGPMVSVCSTPDDWAAAARQALDRKAGPGHGARRSFASNHLWPDRAREMLRAIEEAEAGRG